MSQTNTGGCEVEYDFKPAHKFKAIMSESDNVYDITFDEDGTMNFPDEMGKELEWQEGDEYEFGMTEVCEDNGEYKSLYIRNKTAEARLNDAK